MLYYINFLTMFLNHFLKQLKIVNFKFFNQNIKDIYNIEQQTNY